MSKKLDMIKKGFKVVDEDNNPYTVVKVFYKKELYREDLLIPVAVVLRNDKKKTTKKMSVFEFRGNYKVFNAYAIGKNKLEKNLEFGTTKAQKPAGVHARVARAVHQAYADPVNRGSNMGNIIKAIQRQIAKEHEIVANSKISDMSLIYDSIHNNPHGLFHGFIAKSGFWPRMVANVIVGIDWVGREDKFKDYKKEVFEEFPGHSVIVINTQDKKKAFVIGLLKRIILKYPKSQGGK